MDTDVEISDQIILEYRIGTVRCKREQIGDFFNTLNVSISLHLPTTFYIYMDRKPSFALE